MLIENITKEIMYSLKNCYKFKMLTSNPNILEENRGRDLERDELKNIYIVGFHALV